MKKILLTTAGWTLVSLLYFGCALTKPLDRAVADALAQTAARRDLDSLSYRAGFNAASGMSRRLLNDSTSRQVAALLDLLDQKLQRTSGRMMQSLTDSIQYQALVEALGTALSAQINDKVLGKQTEQRLLALRDRILTGWILFLERELQHNVLGDGTRLRIAALRNELLGDSTRLLIGRLRGELTSEETARQLSVMLDAALNPTIQKLDRTINQNLKVTQKYANEIIFALLAAALLIIGWVWYQRRKYIRLVKLLTVQINDIPDQRYYDELTHRIQKEAIKTDMEPALREVLRAQGL